MIFQEVTLLCFFWKLSSCKLCHRICCDVEPTEETYNLCSSLPSKSHHQHDLDGTGISRNLPE